MGILADTVFKLFNPFFTKHKKVDHANAAASDCQGVWVERVKPN